MEDEEAIYAAPMSSDDEDEIEKKKELEQEPGLPSLGLRDDVPEQASHLPRPLHVGRQSRSRKRKLTTEAIEDAKFESVKEQRTLSSSSQAQIGSSQPRATRARSMKKEESEAVEEEKSEEVMGLKLGGGMGWEESSQQGKRRKVRVAYGGSQPQSQSSQVKKEASSSSKEFIRPNIYLSSSPAPVTPEKEYKVPPKASPAPEEKKVEVEQPAVFIRHEIPPLANSLPATFKKPLGLERLGGNDVLEEESSQANAIVADINSSPETYVEKQQERFKNGIQDTQTPICRMKELLKDMIQKDVSLQNMPPFADLLLDRKGVNDDPIEITLPEDEEKEEAKCPICGTIVDADFLKNYNNGKRMNTRMQARFCEAHKKKSAQDAWSSRSYPVINWDELDARIELHHKFIQSILNGAPSYYRNVLDSAVKSGRNRTLKQTVMNTENSLTPGYYGTRGLRFISENIMRKFSPQLRRVAVKDKLVSARGVSGYVQSVLVPEVAVLLIREDMKVDAEQARSIMRDSIAMGDLVNEEIEDVVTRRVGFENDY